MSEILRVAVVGHTNTGKTSLLRTLARDGAFGEVRDAAGTTRHVEGLRLLAAGKAVLELFDTPGMEDAIALLDHVEGLADAGERIDGPERLRRFLLQPAARERFEQEAKVLRQLLDSDAGLYVVDARDPVLPKYRDELELLAGCARPLLPVLNFVAAAEARVEDWRAALARLNFHAVVSFDTVAPALDGERELFATLATLVHAHRPALQQLIDSRAAEAAARKKEAKDQIAGLLLELAACREQVSFAAAADADALTAQAAEQLRATVRAREQAGVDNLLALYGFRHGDAFSAELPFHEGRWEDDLFSSETLKRMSVRLPSGLAKGAAIGVGIDLVAGGLTLGAAAALGAVAGGLWQTLDDYGGRLLARLRGQRELTVDDSILRLVALRQLSLLAALERRGHAALEPVEVSAMLAENEALQQRWREEPLPPALLKARAHAEWAQDSENGGRQSAQRELIDSLG